MPLVPFVEAETIRKTVEAVGVINKGQRYLMELMDPQNKNTFEILFTPNSLGGSVIEVAKVLARSARDTLIARLHIQTLSFGFDGIQFESADVATYAKMMERANEVTITFVENDLAFVRNYIIDWQEDVAEFDTYTNKYIFKENQEFAKRNCKIFLQMGTMVPSPGWITLHGLRPQKIGDVTIGHGETEPWMMEVTFSTDYNKLETLF
ncbi:MAG: hypothetical protein GY853_09825 [PVC group bacterium]|nr:hypothetical protein [PVC group bacterium]